MDVEFTAIWEEFSVPLKSFIIKRIPYEHDAEDILQEVFYKIHNNIGSLEDNSKIHAWVYRITQNTIVDYYRRKRGSMEFMELTEDLVDEQEDDLSANEEIVSCLKAMIDHLPEKYREAIMLTEFQNFTQKELSRKIGLSLSGAKSRIQRARAMLKDTLLGCCHLEFDRLGNVIDYKHKSSDCKYC